MNKKIAIISAAFALSVPIIPAFAQVADLAIKPEGEVRGQVRSQVKDKQLAQEAGTDTQTKKQLNAEKRLEFQDRKEKMAADKCENIANRIANRINRYENNGQMLQKVYGNMKTRLTRLSAQLKTSGADTAKLDADLVTLYAKIDKMFVDQTEFMTALKATQTATCGSTEGDFKTQIENARKVPELIKQDRADIKAFFQTTIKADLQAIMVQLGITPEATEPAEAVETEDEGRVEIKKQKRNSAETTTGTTSTTSSSTSTSTVTAQ